ncbi:uncharacterized protein O3C94_010032 isoform 1-T2 [Discoglossus pictus]
MTSLLLILLITLAFYQNGTFGTLFDGSQGSTGLENLSDADYPDSEIQVKRNPYPVARNADITNWPEHPNMCYFVHEGQSEGQISCRLRFTRSKFNFNPFGLRFGKRENAIKKRTPIPVPGNLLAYLLHLKDKQMALCDEESGEDC